MFFNSNYIIYVSKKKIIILSKTFSLLPCKCYVVLYLSYIISIITIIQLFNTELTLRKKKFLKVQSFFFSKLPLTSFDLVKLTFYQLFPYPPMMHKNISINFGFWDLKFVQHMSRHGCFNFESMKEFRPFSALYSAHFDLNQNSCTYRQNYVIQYYHTKSHF